jgi:hypothetical protein
LLGASNVSMGFPTILATARRLLGGPLEVLAAFGHGRSYGLRMGLLGHTLPGIMESGLWQALERRPPAPTAALLTDVDNALICGVGVSDVLTWVETCLDRLLVAGARVVVLPVPLCRLATLSPARFLFFRTLFFPGSRLPYATALGRASDLDRRLRALARARGALLAEQRPEWYGFDPIHIRRRCRPAAWREVLSRWTAPAPAPARAAASPRHSLRLRLLAPECRWVFGRERRAAQPAGRLSDGTTVALY